MGKFIAVLGAGVTLALAGGLTACGAGTSPSAQEVASSVVGDTVNAYSYTGDIVHSASPTGLVHTDAAGDATVPVLMDLHAGAGAYGEAAGTNDGDFPGTVTLYANGSATLTITVPS